MTEGQEAFTQDEIFGILSNGRRRYVLSLLKQADGPVHINELTKNVAAWENDIEVDELTDQQAKRVYVSLYQSHLPKLESLGIVEYTEDDNLVALTDEADRIDRFLGDPSDDIRWQRIYLGLALVSVSLSVFVWVDLEAIPQIPPLLVGILISVAVATTALVQYAYERYRTSSPPEEFSQRF